MKRLISLLTLTAAAVSTPAIADEITEVVTTTTVIVSETTNDKSDQYRQRGEAPSLFGGKGDELVRSHFSWGADLGTGIDLTTSGMTTIDLHAYLGYKSEAVKFIGVGAGINTMINNSSRTYPIYAMLRTSFTSSPKLCFMDLRMGFALSKFYEYKNQANFFGSIGIGVVLAHSRRFSSHLIVGYTFLPVHRLVAATPAPGADGTPAEVTPQAETDNYTPSRIPDLQFASIRIGCSF